ncbi:MAG: hypothetical protein LBJ11_10945 [Oscillospiraceae bacterium]|nr:hypothetical protein [Oscillospiraceae bacterium]
MGEKALHGIVKLYCAEGDGASCEVRVGRYVADVVGESGVLEVQTRDFGRLRPKLAAFLSVTQVTVVHPIAAEKWICWADPNTGELRSRRKSPRKGTIYHIFPELYRLGDIFPHPNLRFRVLLLQWDEYRLLDGDGAQKKRRASWADKQPLGLCADHLLAGPADYAALLPPGLPESFTSLDLSRRAGIPRDLAQTTLLVMTRAGAVVCTGKAGRSKAYRVAAKEEMTRVERQRIALFDETGELC